ncbi:MAG: hypothetical protein A2Y07_11095 [Planctomycetes bacterium GWF2_50_10]|nr:MAG: hypothetical protein A2Y07_11095 [Planctomycetes bacterium GWF2_50_10]
MSHTATELQYDNISTLENKTPQFQIWAFWIALFISGAIAAVLYKNQQSTLAFIIMGIPFAISMLVAPQIAFYVYFFWQAFDASMAASETAVFTPAKALSLFIVALYLVSIGRIRTQILVSKKFVWIMLAFSVIGIVGSTWAIASFASLRYGLQIFVQLVLVIAVLQFIDSPARIRTLMFWCFGGGVLAAITMIITGGVSSQYSRGTLGEYANPNTTALAFSVALMCLPILILYSKKRILLFCVYIIGALIILLGMMKTGSRSSILAVFGSICIGAVLSRNSGTIKKIFIPALVCIVIFGTWQFVSQSGLIDEKSKEHLGSLIGKGSEQDSNSRLNIWATALHVYANHGLITGFGFGNTAFAMEKYQMEFVDIHNTILSSLMDGGPIGFGLFMTGLALLFIFVWRIKNHNTRMVAIMMFFYLIINCGTHTIHFTKWFWIPVTICLLLAEGSKREEIQNELASTEFREDSETI